VDLKDKLQSAQKIISEKDLTIEDLKKKNQTQEQNQK
jgi:hypothetical protein